MKFFNSIRFRILIIYFSLAAVNIAFFSSVIFENQIDLITDNIKYKTEKLVSTLLISIKNNTSETKKKVLPGSDKEKLMLQDIVNIVKPVVNKYFIFNESGKILFKSGESISPPDTYITDGLQASTEVGFSGSDYVINVDEKKQEMNFFIPLSRFGLPGNTLLIGYDIHNIGRRLDELYSQAFLILIVTVIFHLVFAIILFRTLVKPIKILAEESMKISAGEFSSRVQIDRKDEFGSLAQAFNTMAGSIEDKIAELQRQKEKIEEISITDELTGLYNRRLLFERLNQEINRTMRSSQPIALLILDIDYFKKINDTYGHQAGDEVLKAIADVLKDNCRPMDTPARYGGEEFILIAPDCDIENIMMISERIRAAVEQKSVETSEGVLNVTVSIGAISMNREYLSAASTPEKAIIYFADTALYRAKEKGRNRVEVG